MPIELSHAFLGVNFLHIAIFTDQNPASLGGSQASVTLQKKFLEAAGHRVTVFAPKGNTPPAPGVVTYPSLPLTLNGEFSFTFRIRKSLKVVNRKYQQLALPVDLVHVQADNWGASLGNKFAQQHNLPLVYTLHTNMAYALNKFVGKAGSKFVSFLLSSGYRFQTGIKNARVTTDPWKYQASITANADLVLAPSQHFADLAMKHGVAERIEVLPNGVDDKFAAKHSADIAKPKHVKGSPVELLWCGRISPEKRIMVFLEAMKLSKCNAVAKIYGSGQQLDEAQRYVQTHKLDKKVKFMGRLSHNDMLLEMRDADVLVQTSVGFETQGMTVYEAGVMGTPSIICDHNIASDVPADSYWLVADESAQALAEAITQACTDVEADRSKKIDLRAKMLQSKITELQLKYYAEALKAFKTKQK